MELFNLKMFPLSPNFPSTPPQPELSCSYHPNNSVRRLRRATREGRISEDVTLRRVLLFSRFQPGLKKPVLLFWVVISIIKGFFFALSGYLQLNDPDPYLWVPAYTIPSVLSFHLAIRCIKLLLIKRGPYPQPPPTLEPNPTWIDVLIQMHLFYSTLLGMYTLFLADEEDKEMTGLSLMMFEEAKELIGLCVVIAWGSLLAWDNFVRVGVKSGMLGGLCLVMAPLMVWIFVGSYEEEYYLC